MQVTIDIPEPLYSELESRASASRLTLEALLLDGASQMLHGDFAKNTHHEPSPLLPMNLNDFWLMTKEETDAFEEQFARDPEKAITSFGLRRLDDAE